MFPNLNNPSLVNPEILSELQELFESETENFLIGLEDADLYHQLDFSHKNNDGNYQCVTTLALFNLFAVGYPKGQEGSK